MPVTMRCEVCEREYAVNPAQARRGRRFCSNRCRGVWIATSKTDEERFWEKVDRAGPVPPHAPDLGPCWLWTGHRMVSGYGAIAKRKPGGLAWTYAHRRSWEMANGPIPEGKHVLHACDNPPCVNPAHLSVGTQAENTADAAAKGRMRHGDDHRDAKLRAEHIPEIETMRAAGITLERIADLYGVSHATISDAMAGRTWKHVERTGVPAAPRKWKLSRTQVCELLVLHRVGGIGPTRLAAIYGVSRQTVNDILAGRTWKRLTGSV